ncbi:MAG: hypothetical protein HY814_11015 [Candidatus Riflebacteria bacterium]|nr:hypothetical protein [Candidatus Riflebacteria bacterium]
MPPLLPDERKQEREEDRLQESLHFQCRLRVLLPGVCRRLSRRKVEQAVGESGETQLQRFVGSEDTSVLRLTLALEGVQSEAVGGGPARL